MIGYTYIMTNYSNTTLYIGATADLVNRVAIHKDKNDPKAFSCRYKLTKLVHYEILEDLESAFLREKQIKNLVRRKKNELVSIKNPRWKDLYKEILELNLHKARDSSFTSY